jgi:hypothetical protein
MSMSNAVPRTCTACLQGNHAGHERDWNITPGKTGGSYCPCPGDCHTLPDPVARMFAAYQRKVTHAP